MPLINAISVSSKSQLFQGRDILTCIPSVDLLASLAYPELDSGQSIGIHGMWWHKLTNIVAGCRVGCDLMNLFFCIDEYTDLATADVARSQASIVMDAVRNPWKPRPSGEWIIGEMARQ